MTLKRNRRESQSATFSFIKNCHLQIRDGPLRKGIGDGRVGRFQGRGGEPWGKNQANLFCSLGPIFDVKKIIAQVITPQ